MVAANFEFTLLTGLILLGESMCINRDAAGTPNNAGGTPNTDVDILSITISY